MVNHSHSLKFFFGATEHLFLREREREQNDYNKWERVFEHVRYADVCAVQRIEKKTELGWVFCSPIMPS
jgi:hypothetical protein